MNYGKSKPGELNEEEFVKFWADLYALFDKIDKDGGKLVLFFYQFFKKIYFSIFDHKNIA